MNYTLDRQYRITLWKYRKFRHRFERRLRNGTLNELSVRHRSRLMQTIERLRRKLAAMQAQLKYAAAGLGFSLALGMAEPALAQAPAPVSAEFLVNTTILGSQSEASVASDKNGDFVVVYSHSYFGNNRVFFQRYNAAGQPQGSQSFVSGDGYGYEHYSSVAMDDNGDFVVVWKGSSYGYDGVFGRKFGSAGNPLSPNFQVSISSYYYQTTPRIAMDADGDFAVTWASEYQDGDYWGVYMRRFDNALTPAPRSGEIQVNSAVVGNQIRPHIAMDNDGDFVIVWSTDHVDGYYYDVFAQRYDKSGNTQGGNFMVNDFTTDNQWDASVAMDDGGDFVVAWTDYTQEGYGAEGIYAKRYDAAGNDQTGEIHVNQFTYNFQGIPAVSMDSDGDFVVTWTSYGQEPYSGYTYPGYGVYGRRYTVSGAPLGNEFQINNYTTNNQRAASVAFDANGDFVVVWESWGQDYYGGYYSTGYGVYARRYIIPPNQSSSEFQVNSLTTYFQWDPAVAADADGDYVVVWTGYGDGSGYGIWGRMFDSGGNPKTSDIQINTYNYGNQSNPAVAMDDNGDFVVVWQTPYEDGYNSGIFARQFDKDGTPGPEFQVNTTAIKGQFTPTVGMDAAGDFVVAWSGYGTANLYGVYARRYDASGSALDPSEISVNTFTDYGGYDPSIAVDDDGDFVVVWQSNNQDGSGDGIMGRRFAFDGTSFSEFVVNTTTYLDQNNPSVSMDPDGNYVVAWQSDDGDGRGIYAQRFDASDVAVGSEISLNTYTTNDQLYPTVAIDDFGDFVVTWQSYGQDGNLDGIFTREVQGDGSMGPEFQVNELALGVQREPAVAMDDAGDFIVVWDGLEPTPGAGYGIFARRFKSSAESIPKITAVSPLAGNIGDPVTIDGSGFDGTTPGNNTIWFGATQATVSSATDTQLTTDIPPGASYDPITVTTGGLTAYAPLPVDVTFLFDGTLDGSFEDYVNFEAGQPTRQATVADFDGDGKPDVAVADQNAHAILIFQNTSSPGIVDASSLTLAATLPTINYPYALGSGDMDGDGKPDLVAGGAQNFLGVHRNTSTPGSISFSAAVNFSTVFSVSEIVVDDFDGDGRSDVAAVTGSDYASVFRNTGSPGVISLAARQDLAVGPGAFGGASGDLDGDGRPELVVAASGSTDVLVFRNISLSGAIAFDIPFGITRPSGAGGVELGDIDGDGLLDVITAGNGDISIFQNQYSGTLDATALANRVDMTAGSTWHLNVGDLDGDGKLDVIVPDNNVTHIYRNVSTAGTLAAASFNAPADFPNGGGRPIWAFATDIDGDGLTDVIESNENINAITVNRNSNDLSSAAGQPTNLTFSGITPTSFTGNFLGAPSGPEGYIVLMATGEPPDALPADGATYAVNDVIGNADVVYMGPATTFDITSATAGEAYYFKIYAYDGTNYNTGYPLENYVVPPDVTAASPGFFLLQGKNMDWMFVTDSDVDAAGNYYLTGGYLVGDAGGGNDFDPGPGVFTIPSYESDNSFFDCFIAKYTSDGDLVWAKGIGGAGGGEFPEGIKVDNDGNVYVVGHFPTPSIDLDPASGTSANFDNFGDGNEDGFLVELDTDGNYVWGFTLKSPGWDIIAGVDAVDGTSPVYVTGSNSTAGGLFWEQWDHGASFANYTNVTGPGFGKRIVLTGSGTVVVTGAVWGPGYLDAAFATVPYSIVAEADLLYAVYNTDATYTGIGQVFGVTGDVDVHDAVYSSSTGETFLAGRFKKVMTVGSNVLTSKGDWDAFIIKLDNTGSPAWAGNIGGSIIDEANAIDINSSGDVFVTGQYHYAVDFDPGPGTHYMISNGYDAFLLKLNSSDGSYQKAIRFENTGADVGVALSVDLNDDIFLGVNLDPGGYGTVDVDPTPGVFLFPGSNGFIKYTESEPVPTAPADQPMGIDFLNVTENSFDVSFSPAVSAPDGYLVVMSPGPLSVGSDPANGTIYSPVDPFGSNGIVIMVGSETSGTATGLAQDTDYEVTVFAYNGFSNPTYNTTSPLVGSVTTLTTEPTAGPSGLTFSNEDVNSLSLSFTAASPAPDGYIILRGTGPDLDGSGPLNPLITVSPLFPQPMDQITITVDITGTDLEGVAWDNATNPLYLWTWIRTDHGVGAINAPTNVSPATPAQDAARFTNTSGNLFEITLTPTDFFGISDIPHMGIIAKPANWGDFPNTSDQYVYFGVKDGHELQVDDLLGYTDDIQYGNLQVVHAGPEISFDDTGLTADTEYFYYVVAYNGSGGSINYYNDVRAGGSTTTLATPNDSQPPTITNTTPGTVEDGSDLTVTATVTDASGVASVEVKFFSSKAKDFPSAPAGIALTNSSGDTWTGTIGADQIPDEGLVCYFIATDNISNETQDPEDGAFLVSVTFAGGMSLPFNGFGSDQTNYRMISVPFPGSSVSSIFGDELGSADKSKWRMFHYSNGSNNEITGGSFQSGFGYWLIIKDNVSFNSGSVNGPTKYFNSPATISVSTGWNQVGNPYLFDLSWDDVTANNPGVGSLRVFNGSYSSSSTLSKFGGAFVLVDQGVSNLSFDYGTGSGGRVEEPNPGRTNPFSSDRWQVLLNLSNGYLSYGLGGVGMYTDAKDGFDHFDEITLPRFLDYIELNHVNKSFVGYPFSKDIVPTSENHIWDFTVDTNTPESVITITWDNSYFGDNDSQLYLWDVAQERAINMREVAGYSFHKNTSHEFKIFFGDEAFIRDHTEINKLRIHAVVPNPATNRQLLTVAFSLPAAESEVGINLYNTLGQPVANIAAGAFDKGYHEVTWDPAGVSPKEGMYLLEVHTPHASAVKRVVFSE